MKTRSAAILAVLVLTTVAECGTNAPPASRAGNTNVVEAAPSPLSSPATRAWDSYRVIMWVSDSAWQQPARIPLFFQRLREMGVNTGMVFDDADPAPYLENQFPYYVENIVNRGLCLKWSSKVRDWDGFVTRWRQARGKDDMVREYCLDDPAWRAWARGEMQATARRHREHAPLAYDIRDELSVTLSANPFDYDFAPATLARFRAWLKAQYADLGALNRSWETRFPSWDEVTPFTTDEIKNRMASGDALPRGTPDWQALVRLKFDPTAAPREPTRWNFAPWVDFRTYMDIALAETLDELRRAAREIDPLTPVGIEGTQMPHAFGGYDLWRLSQAVDWVEPYDIGQARAIFGSFMPGKPIVATISESDTPHALRRLWHLLLEGDRGCIVWWSEDCIDGKNDDLPLTPKARALAPALREMTEPLAALFLQARREYDPIAINYSQASIQIDWLLESIEDGSTWVRRFSSYEAEHNRLAKVRGGWLKALQDLGYSPRFVAAAQIENGLLSQAGYRVLVLPGSVAMSDRELEQVRLFREARGGAAVLADAPVSFDEHGRLRPHAAFAATAPPGSDLAAYAADRLQPEMPSTWAWIGAQCKGVKPAVTVRLRGNGLPYAARAAVYRYALGRARLVAVERNIHYQMTEDLRQLGANDALEKPVDLDLQLDAAAYVYDLREAKLLGRTDRLAFTLDPWRPSLFALLPEQAAETNIVASLQRHAHAD